MQPVTVYIQCEVSPGLIYTFPIETGFSTYILLCQHWRNRKSTLRMDITDSLSDYYPVQQSVEGTQLGDCFYPSQLSNLGQIIIFMPKVSYGYQV